MTLKRRVDKKIQYLSPEVVDVGRKRVSRVQNQILATLALLFASTSVAPTISATRATIGAYTAGRHDKLSYEWRIIHAISHHMYTHTIYDFELSGIEPFFDFKASPSSSTGCSVLT